MEGWQEEVVAPPSTSQTFESSLSPTNGWCTAKRLAHTQWPHHLCRMEARVGRQVGRRCVSVPAERVKLTANLRAMPTVPEREPELPFLRSFLADVDAAYLYRSASLWCASAGIDSRDALRSHAQEFFAEPFCSTLLSFTRSRIERALAECGGGSGA